MLKKVQGGLLFNLETNKQQPIASSNLQNEFRRFLNIETFCSFSTAHFFVNSSNIYTIT